MFGAQLVIAMQEFDYKGNYQNDVGTSDSDDSDNAVEIALKRPIASIQGNTVLLQAHSYQTTVGAAQPTAEETKVTNLDKVGTFDWFTSKVIDISTYLFGDNELPSPPLKQPSTTGVVQKKLRIRTQPTMQLKCARTTRYGAAAEQGIDEFKDVNDFCLALRELNGVFATVAQLEEKRPFDLKEIKKQQEKAEDILQRIKCSKKYKSQAFCGDKTLSATLTSLIGKDDAIMTVTTALNTATETGTAQQLQIYIGKLTSQCSALEREIASYETRNAKTSTFSLTGRF